MNAEYNSTVSVRMPVSILSKLDSEVKCKKFHNRSEAIITRIQSSYELDNLMEIAKNPQLQKEMDEKIKQMTSNSSVEQTLETMTISQRNAIIFYANNLNKKLLEQKIL